MDLANSLSKLQSIAQDSSNIATDPVSFRLTSSNRFINNSVKLSLKVARIEKVTIEDLELDFTIPGYDIELRVRHKTWNVLLHVRSTSVQQENGRNIPVTSANVDEYVHEVLDTILGKGIQIQAKAFRDGFSKVFPMSDLRAFTADELVMLFGNADEDWSIESQYFVYVLYLSRDNHLTCFLSSTFGSFEGRPWL